MTQPSIAPYAIKINAGPRPLVSVDNFLIEQNTVSFLFGESGIGKSLLCKALYGLLDESGLDVSINDHPYAEYCASPGAHAIRNESFFVFQEPSSHLNPLLTIHTQLTEGSLSDTAQDEEILRNLWQSSSDDAIKRIIDIFPKPYRPSGGEKQRILLAMAFKKIGLFLRQSTFLPSFFVFDEPTGSLDNKYRNLFLSMLLERFMQRPFTAVIITHDYSIISEVYSRYQRLLPSIRFKELTRLQGDHDVTLRDFSAQEYLTWLRSAQATQRAPVKNEPVLVIQPQFSIFGRHLGVFRDLEHTQPSQCVIHRGEMVYVKAPSGVGKTTLAKIIMGLYHADSVNMTLCGKHITEKTPHSLWPKKIWGRIAGMVFQHADEALDLEATVRDTFGGLPLREKITDATITAKLNELFEEAISETFLAKKVKHLSGGQKQRLNLLRTLSLGTDLIILDEPLNALDFDSVRKVLALIDQKRTSGTAILMISHNEEIFDALVGSESMYYLGELSA